MEITFNNVKKLLNKYNQGHLLNFYDDLDEYHKQILLNQIAKTNFEKILTLYKNSLIEDNKDYDISPLPYINKSKLSKKDISYYTKIGENAIKNNEFAVVTLAGGQGTRLGHAGPKGTFELDLPLKKKSLFEILNDGLKSAKQKYHIDIPWYIMTSHTNHDATKNFFAQNNFFGYRKDYINFFMQDKLPIIDINAKILLEETYLIKEASNGNGNVYKSLAKNGVLQDMKKMGIKWIFIGGIDNILLKVVDPLFLGLFIDSNTKVASKTIFKENPLDKECVFCKKNGKPSILDYNKINLEMSESVDENGNYLYREVNVLSHLLTINAMEKASNLDLPYHRAFKKNTFINEEGMKQVPEERNCFKFETFIFDAFSFFDNLLLFRVDKDEFAPIKDAIGINSPEAATKLYVKHQLSN